VSEIAGTTRDPIDATFTHADTLWRIVDTAGIRRQLTGAESVEWVSVLKARQALEHAEVAMVLVDGTEDLAHQDRAIVGMVVDSHRPVVLAVNKIDLIKGATRKYASGWRACATTALRPGCRRCRCRRRPAGGGRILTTLAKVRDESRRRFSTAELNRALESIVSEISPERRRPPGARQYISQGRGAALLIVFGNGRRLDPPTTATWRGASAGGWGSRTRPLHCCSGGNRRVDPRGTGCYIPRASGARMVLFNYSTRELTAKIVYYGPGLCGKTTNLQFVYNSLPEGVRKGKMLSLATRPTARSSSTSCRSSWARSRMRTQVQLYTVPARCSNSTRKLVLKGADGVVFVADS
jgi:hypothetical protein